jgi:outer membrane protein
MLDDLAASSRQLQAAQDVLAIVRGRFKDGCASVCDVQHSQSMLSRAQRRRLRCIARWRSARSRMLASAGDLG